MIAGDGVVEVSQLSCTLSNRFCLIVSHMQDACLLDVGERRAGETLKDQYWVDACLHDMSSLFDSRMCVPFDLVVQAPCVERVCGGISVVNKGNEMLLR